MNILVTGSAGFIGFHVTKALLKRGDTVVGFDNFNAYYDAKLKEDRNAILEKEKNFSLIRGELAKKEDVQKAFDALGKDGMVCHLGAQAGVRHSIDHPEVFVQSNLVGFGNILECARQGNVQGLIYASTSSVYGNDTPQPFKEDTIIGKQVSFYGATKRSNEFMAASYHHLYGIRTTGLRFFTVYGPWGRPDMALFKFTNAILHDKPIDIFGQGKMKRDFTFIDDIVQGVVAAIDNNFEQEIINLGGGHTEELMDFISIIEKTIVKDAQKNFTGMQLGDIVETSADVSKAKKLLGYDPKTRIEEGVPKFVEWYREYYHT